MPAQDGLRENAVDCASEPGRSPPGVARVFAVPADQGDLVTVKRIVSVTSSVALACWLALGASVAGASTAHRVPSSPARSGAAYLAQQIDSNGGYVSSFGQPDVTNTAYAVLGLHAVGAGAKQEAKALTFLATQLDNVQASDGSDDPGALGYVTMAAVASGRDPRHFGGRAPANDLVRRLLATVRTTGPDAGLFGSADPTFDGAFRQGVALAALAAAHVPSWRVRTSIGWLERQQCSNGLWTAYRADTSVPCPAADPATFAGPDTNSTSMAVQGLAAYGRHPRWVRVVLSLLHAQSSDGGYPYLATTGQPSDPSSTALTVQALLAERIPPSRRTFDALHAYQLGCSDPVGARGAYFFPPGRSPNTFATVQAVPAAARHTLPLRPSHLSSSLPSTACPPGATGTTGTVNTVSAHTVSVTGAASAAISGTAGPCPGTSGVTVVVDFTAFGGTVQTRCAPGSQPSGIAALQNAGFIPVGTRRFGFAFVCRINDLPSAAQQDCVSTPPGNAYWAYYHALAGATSWSYASSGPTVYAPPLGSIDAWAFGNSATPSRTPAQIRGQK
jgi:hypothetical protein